MASQLYFPPSWTHTAIGLPLRRPRMVAAASPSATVFSCAGISENCPIRRPRGMACLETGFRLRSARGSRIESARAELKRWISCFKDPMRKGKSSNKKVETESCRGGEDLWASGSAAPGRFPEHLVIMVNGLGGRYFALILKFFFLPFSGSESFQMESLNPKNEVHVYKWSSYIISLNWIDQHSRLFANSWRKSAPVSA